MEFLTEKNLAQPYYRYQIVLNIANTTLRNYQSSDVAKSTSMSSRYTSFFELTIYNRKSHFFILLYRVYQGFRLNLGKSSTMIIYMSYYWTILNMINYFSSILVMILNCIQSIRKELFPLQYLVFISPKNSIKTDLSTPQFELLNREKKYSIKIMHLTSI